MNTVITGTSRGIGLELLSQALNKGHRVLAVARLPHESPALQALVRQHPSLLEIVAVDVGDEDAPQRILNALQKWDSVDLLINNAGVYYQGEAGEDFRKSFEINVIAPFLISKALLPKLHKSQNPKLIQITSLMGSLNDNESGGSYAYRSSKAALNMVTRSLSIDEAWLTCALIHPGWVQTRMGGSEAPTQVAESVTGIWKVIERLGKEQSGQFFDFEGDRLPW